MQRSDALPQDDRPAPQRKSRWRTWLNWLDSTDPGLMRLQMATEVVVAIGIVGAVEGGFVPAPGRPQLVTLLFLPLPLLGMLAVGLSVHVRVASLALLAITLAIGTYCRRLWARGGLGGAGSSARGASS